MMLRAGRGRLPVTGRGWGICDRSGKQGSLADMVDDVRGGRVLREFADFTPGFGTQHPQDVARPPLDGPDPRPFPHPRPQPPTLTLWERGYTDADVLASIRAGTSLGASPGSWILTGGAWRDAGVWHDTGLWSGSTPGPGVLTADAWDDTGAWFDGGVWREDGA